MFGKCIGTANNKYLYIQTTIIIIVVFLYIGGLMISYKALIGYITLTVIIYFAGIQTHIVYTGYKLSEYQKMEKLVSGKVGSIEQSNAKNLEDIKKSLEDRKVLVVDKEIPVVITKPIYKNICADEEGIGILEKYKKDSQVIINGVAK